MHWYTYLDLQKTQWTVVTAAHSCQPQHAFLLLYLFVRKEIPDNLRPFHWCYCCFFPIYSTVCPCRNNNITDGLKMRVLIAPLDFKTKSQDLFTFLSLSVVQLKKRVLLRATVNITESILILQRGRSLYLKTER